MNILCDKLPSYIEIDGKKYEINTDFRIWIKFQEIMESGIFKPNEKIVLAILNCFTSAKCKSLPPDSQKTIDALFCFFGGKSNNDGEKQNSKFSKKIFDFTKDADYILSAFYQEYGIDLTVCNMHWYKFLALLNGLTDRTRFVKILEYRSIDPDGIKDEKKRNFYRKMKKIYALSQDGKISEQDIADKLTEAF